MKRKSILIPAFLMMILAQWLLPGKMIWDNEQVLRTGTAYKFKIQPIDPYDPFRGKYIVLDFEANRFVTPSDQNWNRRDAVHVHLGTDDQGFAKILDLSIDPPSANPDYVQAEIARIRTRINSDSSTIRINYPFHTFYMEESKAYDAEVYTRRGRLDSNQVAYALVNVLDGKAVIQDVFINDTPIREFVLEEKKNEASDF
ncbi:MAG: GDYXXLXY domain-containing protein [Bacteroidota bacterium]